MAFRIEYNFNPRANISAFEVALLIRPYYQELTPEQFADVPVEVQRHFDRVEVEIKKPQGSGQNDSS